MVKSDYMKLKYLRKKRKITMAHSMLIATTISMCTSMDKAVRYQAARI